MVCLRFTINNPELVLYKSFEYNINAKPIKINILFVFEILFKLYIKTFNKL